MRIKVNGKTGGVVGSLFLFLFGMPFFLLGMTFVVLGSVSLVYPDWMDGTTWAKLMAVIMGGIFAGVGGLVIWGGLSGLAPGSSRPGGQVLSSGSGTDGWPNFPKAKTRGRSAGGEILRAEVTRGMALVGLLFATILWNGISWVAMWAVMFENDDAPIFVKALIGLFCLIGIGLVIGVIRQILIMLTWAGTQVEVGKELLKPGESTRVRVSQRGDFAIDRIQLKVVAREYVRYRVGTNTRTQIEELWSSVIAEERSVRAQNGRPILDAVLEIPREAMHSFDASNNKVQWMICMEVDAPARVDIKEEYPFRVAPEVGR